MPTYDYACPACGGFDALRSLAARGMKAWVCGKIEPRTAESGSALVSTYQAR